MPISAIVNSARALSYYVRAQEVTAHNLANSESDGFKAHRLAAHGTAGATFPTPTERVDLRQGRLRETGRALDVAVDGDAFLVVETGGGERWIRGGSLRLDVDGTLVDAHGDPVLGEAGTITVQGGDVTIRADGTVEVDRAPVARLRLETADALERLEKEGSGRFVPASERREVGDDARRVLQGRVEEANLDPVLSMVDLITIQRSYALNVDALKALDGVLGTITNEVGRVGP